MTAVPGAISLSQYVKITSAVGGSAAFPGRAFIARIMSTNPLIPTGSYIEFSNAADVGTYFGTNSEEYARASFYFSFISKNATQPQLISFGRWANAATAPLIYGEKQTALLATFTAHANWDFTLQMGSFTHHFTAIDLTAASSLTNVASIIESVIQAYSAGGSLFTGATVTWDSANGQFDLVAGATGPATISVTAGVTEDLAAALGWESGAIFSNGVAVETITTTLTNTAELSNNFGSYTFTYAAALDLAQVTESAAWNITNNVAFMYQVAVTAANTSSWQAALSGYEGTGLTLQGPSGEYHEMMPMCIQAATVFSNPNSVQDYEYYQFPTLTPTVTSTAQANAYNAININYLGQTQSAGVFRAFYQQGILQGVESAGAITDMGPYANEQWFKDALADAWLNLQLALASLFRFTHRYPQSSLRRSDSCSACGTLLIA